MLLFSRLTFNNHSAPFPTDIPEMKSRIPSPAKTEPTQKGSAEESGGRTPNADSPGTTPPANEKPGTLGTSPPASEKPGTLGTSPPANEKLGTLGTSPPASEKPGTLGTSPQASE